MPMTFVSFAAAAAIIALCIRLRNRENQKKGGTSKSNRNEQEEKAYEETNTQHPAHLVYGAMPCADGGLCRGQRGYACASVTSVDITFPKPEEGKKIGDGSAASASGLTFLEFGPALWQQDGEPKKLKADDTYEKDNIYLLYFAFYTQKPITDETALTFNGQPYYAL